MNLYWKTNFSTWKSISKNMLIVQLGNYYYSKLMLRIAWKKLWIGYCKCGCIVIRALALSCFCSPVKYFQNALKIEGFSGCRLKDLWYQLFKSLFKTSTHLQSSFGPLLEILLSPNSVLDQNCLFVYTFFATFQQSCFNVVFWINLSNNVGFFLNQFAISFWSFLV